MSGSMSNDRVLRLDPADRKVGRVSVAAPDQYSPHFRRQHHYAVTFWAGNNHHAAILKIEPLD